MENKNPETEIAEVESESGNSVFWQAVILATAFFLIHGGIAELAKFIAETVFKIEPDEQIHLLNVVFIPVGIGLIIRRKRGRGCGLWLFGVLFFASAFLVGSLVFDGSFTDPLEWLAILAVFYLIASGLSWWAIKREKPMVEGEIPEKVSQRNRATIWAFVIISICINVMMIRFYVEAEAEANSVFRLDHSIFVFDAETKEPISDFILHGSGSHTPNHPKNEVSMSFPGSNTLDDESRYGRVEGIVFGTYEFAVSTEVHEKVDISIDKNSDRKLDIYLPPIQKSPED